MKLGSGHSDKNKEEERSPVKQVDHRRIRPRRLDFPGLFWKRKRSKEYYRRNSV
jgi:hypothetical protein